MRSQLRFARARVVAVGLLVTAGALAGGCGNTGNTSGVASPYKFDASALSGAPMPKDAVPFSNVVVSGTTSTQSFRITGSTPQAAITAYVTRLEAAGWKLADGPSATGTTDWRAKLSKHGADLLVTAAPAHDKPASNAPDVEISVEVTTA